MNKATFSTKGNRSGALRSVVLGAVFTFVVGSLFARTANAAAPVHCDKPVAKVMVGEVTCKAAGCGTSMVAFFVPAGEPKPSDIGSGVKEMLTASLQESGCFDVLSRDFVGGNQTDSAQDERSAVTASADFFISASITRMSLGKSSNQFGSSFLPVQATQRSSLGIDLKVVSVKTNSALNTSIFEVSQVSPSYVCGLGAKVTSFDAVARDVVSKATHYLVVEVKAGVL